MYKKICFFIASVFGVGYAPVASGTWGSFVTLPLCWYLIRYQSLQALYIALAITCVVGWIATLKVLKYTKPDPSLVVIDEVAGQLTTFTLPWYFGYVDTRWVSSLKSLFKDTNTELLVFLLAGFVLFRFFDIVKVWPASYFDKKVHNAFGVMADDIVAGLYAAGSLTLLCYFFK